ncbi:MAG: hypothetical protein ABSA92_10720 [Candidatus Bathyarchaeia archaeon]|jgi:cytosine/adenosine deaminase-related metal-dependent hydrolase
MNSDLVVRNARLRSGKVCDIAIKNGRIEQIGGSVSSARRMIDAQSNLVTEAFVIPHLHLDKVMTGYLADESALNEYQGAQAPLFAMGGAEGPQPYTPVQCHYTMKYITGK